MTFNMIVYTYDGNKVVGQRIENINTENELLSLPEVVDASARPNFVKYIISHRYFATLVYFYLDCVIQDAEYVRLTSMAISKNNEQDFRDIIHTTEIQ